MTKIVFLDRGTIGPTVTINHPSFAHSWEEFEQTAPDQVVQRLKGAEIAITNKVPIRADHLEHLPDLKMIAVAATGYNILDVAACRAHGAVASNVRRYAQKTVPEHVFALIFALRRNLVGYRQDVIDGVWQKSGQFCFFTHPIKDLSGSRLGIIGGGALGEATGAIGRALGMEVVYAGRKGGQVSKPGYLPFEEVLATSDVLSLHCPLTPETEGLISLAEFEQMAQRPLLINTARGGLVDEAALVEALNRGLIAGAGFDVLTSEPPASDNPLMKIAKRPNVIITPHVAWASEEAMQTLWDQLIGHIENYKRGHPTNVIT
ncbi:MULTISPECIES: D-2-hydroxyacid dehydrogenase [Pseudovibrio]|uniref:D-2-hydroxyacid dehydrogenase n=1 Tax=Stappiaceae TaxID=2821832 RepID=UPI00236646A0|nr:MULTISPECIES: D-2-hydroxyacid dehydrogenase [Pseudovibrio]MDD7911652.1 D-2-hydroxyacid dehydrogenase [Pseudovibrio exalbescens]MDX5594388.1 D-2-hydroxyacid dehydrogenase [Pseudovibrio sp. SPO723]